MMQGMPDIIMAFVATVTVYTLLVDNTRRPSGTSLLSARTALMLQPTNRKS